MTEQHNFGKWFWMTDYCKAMNWSPYITYNWVKAEAAYYKSFGVKK